MSYPILDRPRYLASDIEGWYTTAYLKAQKFATVDAANAATKEFLEGPVIRELPGITCVLEAVPSFDPDWVTIPGHHLKECIEESRTPISDFLAKSGLTAEFLNELFNGKAAITEEVAEKLFLGIHVSKEFWLNLEKHYRDGIEKGLKVV